MRNMKKMVYSAPEADLLMAAAEFSFMSNKLPDPTIHEEEEL